MVSRRRAGPGPVLAGGRGRSRLSPERVAARIPVTAIGLGSNLIIRDGGVEGVVIRLGGRAFNAIDVMDDSASIAGAAAPDQSSPRRRRPRASPASPSCAAFQARSAAALRMNAGAHGGEIKDVLIEAQRRRPFRRQARLLERRNGLLLPALFCARRRHLHPRCVSGPPGRSGRDRGGDGANHPRPRSLAADPREDRRLDLQEPARAARPGS